MMNTTQIGSIDQLKLVFEKFDVNGDGKISNSELGSLMSSLGHSVKKEELQRMMEEMDSDGDGFVDLNEFIELHTNGMDSAKVLDDVKNAFLIFDMNGDGSISPQDLQKVLRNLGQSCSIAECRRMINGFDSDGDGMMNFEDFKVMMMGPPQQT
ncbi:Calmodulin [Thalictrum thalictroides]|uniref:Calmodulin n=1 Tax=Thalictrum thalictroides TaxID=46969 RepID=A0A7J6W8J0_THATH|nr:Calmodulin [Thalictrum thalictroides]